MEKHDRLFYVPQELRHGKYIIISYYRFDQGYVSRTHTHIVDRLLPANTSKLKNKRTHFHTWLKIIDIKGCLLYTLNKLSMSK